MARPKAESPLLGVIHQTASDLARLGLIEKRNMRQYDVLCLAPVEPFDAEKIKKLRRSQRVI